MLSVKGFFLAKLYPRLSENNREDICILTSTDIPGNGNTCAGGTSLGT